MRTMICQSAAVLLCLVSGFRAIESCPDSPVVLEAKELETNLTKPNCPENYIGNITCKWIISVPFYTELQVKILKMDLQQTDDCTTDRLSFYQVSPRRRHLIAKHCGTSSGAIEYDVHGALHLEYTTNSDFCGGGDFIISYHSESDYDDDDDDETEMFSSYWGILVFSVIGVFLLVLIITVVTMCFWKTRSLPGKGTHHVTDTFKPAIIDADMKS